MAAATAAAASTATAREAAGRLRGSAVRRAVRRTENRKLDSVSLPRAIRASDFLLLVDHDFLKMRFAVVADVFVNRHWVFLIARS
jgi:hypothetical protein